MINLGCSHKKYAYNHCGEMSCRNYLSKCPLHALAGSSTATCNLTRAAVLSGLSDETRETADRLIAMDPALEEGILLLIELAFADGEDSQPVESS